MEGGTYLGIRPVVAGMHLAAVRRRLEVVQPGTAACQVAVVLGTVVQKIQELRGINMCLNATYTEADLKTAR